MTGDQVIAFGASVGACLSAVATFLTVRQIARQREASYKPELVVLRTHFRGTTNPLAKSSLPNLWTEHVPGTKPPAPDQWRSFSVPLRNIGFGAAKAVEVSWSLPLGDFAEIANTLAERALVSAHFTVEAGGLLFHSETDGVSASLWENQRLDSVDYVMSAAIENQPAMLVVPHAFIILVSAVWFFYAQGKCGGPLPDIPHLGLQLKYSDIGGRRHTAAFEVNCEVAVYSGEGEVLDGWLEFRKSA